MTAIQKVIKYSAIAFALFLTVSIIGGILSAVGVFGILFGESGVNDEITSYELSGNITSLEIDINAADFTIESSDSFSVESNLRHISVEEKNGVLVIKENKSFKGNYKDPILKLCVPEDFTFDSVSVDTGAGRFTVDVLSASRLRLDLGAGEVSINELNATSEADIEGGAGKLTVLGGVLRNLDLEMGVGEMCITAEILGESDIEYGVGKAELTLLGGKEAYRLDVEKGIGSITVDGEDLGGDSVYGSGDNRIDVSGGIGSCRISFKDK